MKIFIATPAYDGRVHVPYAISLAETFAYLNSKGIQVQMRINTSGSLLVAERNRLIEEFIKTDCTHILFIDSDLGWPYQAIEAMLSKGVDFIAGCYPSRKDTVFVYRPFINEDSSLVVDQEKNLIKMQYIPAGFMLIKRNVIEKVRMDNPNLYFEPKIKTPHGSNGYCLFDTEVYEGEFWGEDYVFCRRVRNSGFDIWVDPMIEFDHAGVRGMLAQILTNDREKAQNMEASKLD